ncbi:hypothetical protein [Desulfospira joergensenii]|uniref:hypothetical protein n=1 Tax=Desulfospira joergensenii TaxID=53329 RepID=UPI0003B3AEA0|nr:hypothetical protein [Desulfospira joergensenii]
MTDLSNGFHISDPDTWRRKATAFVTRTHQHLWGKNNEDPMVFLFRRGLTHDFIRAMHLGWNKFGQKRSPASWGIQHRSASEEDKLFLPAGIVVPHIVEKELKAVFILSMDQENRCWLVPGSPENRLVLGTPGDRPETSNDLAIGLKKWQDSGQTGGIVIEPRINPF